MSIWDGATVLITGGTGSFGQAFARLLLDEPVKVVRILSRDEFKQSQSEQDGRLRYLIGDVRDRDRLYRAFDGVDIVVHAAAMKQVPACEYNPYEAVRTNVIGTQNVIEAAIDRGVSRVMLISTDKACHPVNIYGATKMTAEKLVLGAYLGTGTIFSVVRYGNVVGSRGSIIPLLIKQRSSGTITLTDEKMSRFWLTLDRAVHFTKSCIEDMQGGEVWVPKIPSVWLRDIAQAVAPDATVKLIGLRPGEKSHETLITLDEIPRATDHGQRFSISLHESGAFAKWDAGMGGFMRPYTSDTNTEWVSVREIEACASSASFSHA